MHKGTRLVPVCSVLTLRSFQGKVESAKAFTIPCNNPLQVLTSSKFGKDIRGRKIAVTSGSFMNK